MPLKVGASIPLLTFVVDLFTSNWMLLTKVSSSEHIAGLGVHVEWNAQDACGQVFRYGIASGQCVRNPAADLRDALPPVPTRHHAAIVDPVKAGELLRAMADYQGNPITRAALALSALLFLRPVSCARSSGHGSTLTRPC